MNISTAANQILIQLNELLFKLRPDDYTRPSQLLSGATIGQHVRHSLEFFLCLIEGSAAGVVNYDKRRRDRMIEEDQDFGRKVLRAISDYVKSNLTNSTLKLEVDFGSEEGESALIPSNYFRELTYNIEHTIHHMALIRVAVKEFCPYLELPEDFGVARSTIRYRASMG